MLHQKCKTTDFQQYKCQKPACFNGTKKPDSFWIGFNQLTAEN